MEFESKHEQILRIDSQLLEYARACNINSILLSQPRNVLARQIVDSIRRVEYFQQVRKRVTAQTVLDPNQNGFDPIAASIRHALVGNINEASWLLFLVVHIGKNLETKWDLLKQVYGTLGEGILSFDYYKENYDWFSIWLPEHTSILSGKFGNHRKYETKMSGKPGSLDRVFKSYLDWFLCSNGHNNIFEYAIELKTNPQDTFDFLYTEMSKVVRFGRLAKFDYLTMIAKANLYDIMPGKAYITGNQGPKAGAKLLFFGRVNEPVTAARLESLIDELSRYIELGDMPMQVLEDSLCNWQKSPQMYKLFRG